MNSPSSTARFNFGANDAEFLGNRDTGQFSFGQPNSTIRGSQNVLSLFIFRFSSQLQVLLVMLVLDILQIRSGKAKI